MAKRDYYEVLGYKKAQAKMIFAGPIANWLKNIIRM